MGFIARIFSPPSAPSPAPAPVYTPPTPAPAPIADAAGDTGRDRLRGGAARRRGAGTILSGDQQLLGATQGKSLLGA